MIRNASEYREARTRLAEESERLKAQRTALRTAGLSAAEIKRDVRSDDVLPPPASGRSGGL